LLDDTTIIFRVINSEPL